MPIYVYEIINKTGKRGKTFEVLQKISEAPLKKHPENGKPVRRVFASPSLPHGRFERTVKQVYGKNSPISKNLLRK